jgi:nickel-type superoxide dismutase maturation protease
MGRWFTARVRGRSMLPTLSHGDLLLVTPWHRRPGRGSLVVVRLPERGLAVKRVASFGPGGLWVERDNPREGVDSWLVGEIAWPDLVGVVRARVWPRPRIWPRLWEDDPRPRA